MPGSEARRSATFDLDLELHARLQRLAELRRRAPDLLMRDAVAQFVAREEARERLGHDALAAWTEYEATGLHAKGEDVDAWLARLEAGEEAEPPQCRA